MKYDRGLAIFLEKKKVKSKTVINSFLEYKNVTTFTKNNHRKVNKFINLNWSQFASFVDNGIKSGKFKGDGKASVRGGY